MFSRWLLLANVASPHTAVMLGNLTGSLLTCHTNSTIDISIKVNTADRICCVLHKYVVYIEFYFFEFAKYIRQLYTETLFCLLWNLHLVQIFPSRFSCFWGFALEATMVSVVYTCWWSVKKLQSSWHTCVACWRWLLWRVCPLRLSHQSRTYRDRWNRIMSKTNSLCKL